MMYWLTFKNPIRMAHCFNPEGDKEALYAVCLKFQGKFHTPNNVVSGSFTAKRIPDKACEICTRIWLMRELAE